MPEAIGKLACAQCGRNYAWKPQYAGRTLKCKCGATISAPAAPPAAQSASSARPSVVAAAKPVAASVPAGAADGDDIERMLSEAQEYEVKEEPAPAPRAAARVMTAQTVIPGATGGAAAVAAAPASPLLGYARTIRKPVDEGTQRAVVTDLYVPLVLIALGLLTYYIDARLYGIHNLVFAGMFIVFKTVINLALVFIALLIGVQLIDLGLGPIGPALLKIAAVAMLPAALSDIIGYFTLGFVPWIFSALLYGALLYVLFEMEYSEVAISTAIIWTVQTWAGMLLVALLLGLVGAGHAPSAGSSSASAVGSSLFGPSPTAQDEPEFDPTPEGQDKHAEYMIEKKDAADAREWLKPEHDDHTGLLYTTDTMLQWTEKFYAAGAKKVWAADFYHFGKKQAAHRLLIEMPSAKPARAAILKLVADWKKYPQPQEDDGGKYLHVSVSRDLDF